MALEPWPTVSIGEVCEGIFDGPHATPAKIDSGAVFLGIWNIENGRIDLSTTEHISEADWPRWTRRVEPTEGDLVFSYETKLGCGALIPAGLRCCLGRRMALARPNRSKVDPRFLLYTFLAPEFQESIRNYTISGSTVDRIPLLEFPKFPMKLPPLPEQRAIARVLGGLDDKIELNRRMNRTLEDLARGVFRSWFVDFDPVLRPAPAHTAARTSTRTHPPHPRFPTRLVDSPLGPIPEGWRVSTIGQEVTVVGGSTPSTDEPKFWEGGNHCWVTPRDLSRLTDPVVIDCERRITDAGLTQISSGLMPRGTVLLSSRAPIGYLAIADVPVAVNQGFIGLKCDKGLPGVFALRWCEENMEEVLSRAGGTTFAEISKAAFRPIPMVVPTAAVIEAFARAAQGWHDQIVANVRQTRQLAALRDALLPQLLSGEIRLREAERAVDDSLRPTSTPARGEGHPRPVARAVAGITKGRA